MTRIPERPGWVDADPGYGGHSLDYEDGPGPYPPSWRTRDTDHAPRAVALMLTPLMFTLAACEAWLTVWQITRRGR